MENVPPTELPETDAQGRKLVRVRVRKKKKTTESVPQSVTSNAGHLVKGKDAEPHSTTAAYSAPNPSTVTDTKRLVQVNIPCSGHIY